MSDEKITSLKNKLEMCKNIDIKNVNVDEIEDIENIKIDTKKSSVERILDFLDSCKNPYFFKVNGVVVQLVFSDDNSINATDCVSRALEKEFKK